MRALIPVLIATIAGPVSAQTWLGPSLAEQNRLRIEQQRLRSAEQQIFARQSLLESRLTQLEIEAARQPPVYPRLEAPLPEPRVRSVPADRSDRVPPRGDASCLVVGLPGCPD